MREGTEIFFLSDVCAAARERWCGISALFTRHILAFWTSVSIIQDVQVWGVFYHTLDKSSLHSFTLSTGHGNMLVSPAASSQAYVTSNLDLRSLHACSSPTVQNQHRHSPSCPSHRPEHHPRRVHQKQPHVRRMEQAPPPADSPDRCCACGRSPCASRPATSEE